MDKNISASILRTMFTGHDREIQDRRDRYNWVCNSIRNYEAGTQELYEVTIEELKAEREQLEQKYGF